VDAEEPRANIAGGALHWWTCVRVSIAIRLPPRVLLKCRLSTWRYFSTVMIDPEALRTALITLLRAHDPECDEQSVTVSALPHDLAPAYVVAAAAASAPLLAARLSLVIRRVLRSGQPAWLLLHEEAELIIAAATDSGAASNAL
jgi:hypothetical protein